MLCPLGGVKDEEIAHPGWCPTWLGNDLQDELAAFPDVIIDRLLGNLDLLPN
jgi:hypothetical protein